MRTSQSIARARGPAGPRRRLHPARRPAAPPRTATLLQARRGPSCSSRRGSLADQVDPRSSGPSGSSAPPAPPADARPSRRRPPRRARSSSSSTASAASPTDGREYVTILGPGQSTPAPWINVIANPSFGFLVVRVGRAATPGRGNSRENQLTPWSNDPVSDPAGEAIYVRDDETRRAVEPDGRCRSAPRTRTYVARHGHGYSRFEHVARRHRARARAVRAARRPGEDLAC